MKKTNGGKQLLVKAKNEAKKQNRRRIKRFVERQAKNLARISRAPSATAPESIQ